MEEINREINYEAFMKVLESVKQVLIEKNKRYGNSALSPLGIFYKGDAANSIKIRLDDKLSRIKNSKELRKNDLYDLLGYCMLYTISEKYNGNVQEGVDLLIEHLGKNYLKGVFNLDKYNSAGYFSYTGFLKDGRVNSNIIKTLNGTCSDIKDAPEVEIGMVESLILYLAIYFVMNDVTDFSDLID